MTRWQVAALAGASLSIALLVAAGGGSLVVIVPVWMVGLALRYDNHTGSLTYLAVGILLAVLVMLGLVALLAMRR